MITTNNNNGLRFRPQFVVYYFFLNIFSSYMWIVFFNSFLLFCCYYIRLVEWLLIYKLKVPDKLMIFIFLNWFLLWTFNCMYIYIFIFQNKCVLLSWISCAVRSCSDQCFAWIFLFRLKKKQVIKKRLLHIDRRVLFCYWRKWSSMIIDHIV